MSKQGEFLLEDEDDIENLLSAPEGASMTTSPTTDTLDSVALEPSPSEDVDKENILSQSPISEVNEDVMASSDVKEAVKSPESVKGKDAGSGEPANNISSYFASSAGGDIFDTLGAPCEKEEEQKLGDDLYTSIAISKSEEDIRVSEMNAREITESDAPGADPGLPRIHSFLRKQEEEEDSDFSQQDSTVEEESTGLVNTAADTTVGDKAETNGGTEEVVMHIHPRREHKTSTSEPETIAFDGEGDKETTQQPELQEISALVGKEGDFEDFTAQNDDSQPGFISQISHTSDSSTSAPSAVPGTPPLPSTPQHHILCPPPLTEPGGRVQGPVLGSTPSQLSPMGTPVHQASEAKESTSHGTVNPLDTQNPVPGSPFPPGDSKPSSVFAQLGGTSSDDAFTSILSMSDADRRHDAWIPSDATNHILKSLGTGQTGSSIPTAEQLSTPGVISNEPQGDPVRDLVLRYMGEQEAVKRSVLTVDTVTQDVDGLTKLIESGCLRAAIDLTGRLLDQLGQGHGKAGQVTVHTPHSLQLWCVRLSLMVKLRMYEQAEAEMRAFQSLDTPDLYFQYYANAYPGRRGSMASFSMRLLHAELPLLCGRSQETLDRLYYMLAVCNRIQSNLASDLSEDGSATHMTFEARKVSQELWNTREVNIIYKIGSTMLAEKDYEGALAIYTSLLEKDKNVQLELRAGIGRIHLQMGNVAEATRIIKEVEADYQKSDSPASCFNLVSKGLVAMCANNFHEAYQSFKSAVQMQPHNTCAVNNMAVCSLYLGRLKDALNTLEQLVHSDPANTLHEGVLFNLCTLYELETSRALHKKQAILDLVSKHKGDGFPVACLKMT